jgi:hypothetical protein
MVAGVLTRRVSMVSIFRHFDDLGCKEDSTLKPPIHANVDTNDATGVLEFLEGTLNLL